MMYCVCGENQGPHSGPFFLSGRAQAKSRQNGSKIDFSATAAVRDEEKLKSQKKAP
jgi:hypothetical protein